jgi:CheY-like chemotaxis protein
MWAESAGAGQGATFHFTVQAQVMAEQMPVVAEEVGNALVGKRGLVVDDNAICQRIVAHQLAAWGIEAHTTASPETALRWLREGERYDFAILDLYMPEMDGFTLARMLRQQPGGADLPLIMLSSHGNRATHAEAETLSFAALLAKPLKQAQLGHVLLEILVHHTPTSRHKTQVSGFDPRLAERMPLRILLAEDNLVNQKVAQHMLARLGYAADVVANGRDALHALERQRYDVVLMDVQMPEMDGLAATHAIVARWPQAERPYIIAMTAHALTGDEAKCIAAGMDAYVSKPIQVEKLVAALMQSQHVPEDATLT